MVRLFFVFLQFQSGMMKLKEWILSFCKPEHKNSTTTETDDPMAKYLIVGLGNVGSEYEGTRHNAGFMVVDALAKEGEACWSLERHAYRTEVRYKGRTLVLIKPPTYMNLSGKAVKYWLQAEKIELQNLLVVVDDIALEVGTMRMKKQGSGGGHNGLGDIEAMLGTQNYCRLRVGVGSHFSRGHQIDYVLGQFTAEETSLLEPVINDACEMVRCFATQGPDRAMNMFNKKGNAHKEETKE